MTETGTIAGLAPIFGTSVSILAISSNSPAHAAEQFECQQDFGNITWSHDACPGDKSLQSRPRRIKPSPPGTPPTT